MNNKVRWVVIAAVGISLLGWAGWERRIRRMAQRRYWEVVERQRELKVRYAKAIAEHQELSAGLSNEKEHSRALSTQLLEARVKIDESIGRLTEESKAVKELQGRLAAMQQRMDQLQGELSVALQSGNFQGAGPAGGKGVVQVELDRIIVGQENSAPLQGRVVSVHPDWNFVVVNLGWDAVKIGEQISIMREDQVLAKARVERIQEGVCAATVLPDWKINDVSVDDIARAL